MLVISAYFSCVAAPDFESTVRCLHSHIHIGNMTVWYASQQLIISWVVHLWEYEVNW